MADSLQAQCDAILRCNAEDMDAARGHISDVMLDRLYLTPGASTPWPTASARPWRCRITRGASSRRSTTPTA